MEVKTTLVVLNSIELYRNMAGENFTHEILYENLNKEAANKIERDLIKKYDSINNGYNIQEGGYTSLTKESLDKMSKSLKQGYIDHPERKKRISEKLTGRKNSEETKRMGCPDDVLHRAASRIEDYENSGFTFTNQEEHKSIIVINRPDSAEEFIDTYNHEKNHVEMHICKEFGIDPYSEKAAYLSGQLAKKLFKAQLKNWIK